MRTFFRKTLVFLLALLMVFTPRMVQMAVAQDDAASSDEVTLMRQLAKDGFLEDKKDFYLSGQNLTEDDVTDGLLKADDFLSQVDLKTLQPGAAAYPVDDLKALLKMVEDKADEIRDRKVSAWKFEYHLKKMIEALVPAEGDETASASPTRVVPTPVPKPTATATPIPGPSRAEWEDLKGQVKDLDKKVSDMQDTYSKRMDAFQKSNDQFASSSADTQEQLKLVKKLLDQVQDDLNKTGSRLDQVAQMATQKSISDTELEQELSVMHKDLRDDTQDVGILKEEVAKLSKEDTQAGKNWLDQVLDSKWLSGGALVVGLAALVVSFTRK